MHQKVTRFYVVVLMVLGYLFPPFLCASGYFNNFEGAEPLDGFAVDGWGIRDVSDCEWGPQTAPSGTMAVGLPETCREGYPNGDPGLVWVATLTTPTFQLEEPTFTFTFSYWADFEGVTDTFDGLIIELINLTRADTVQVDSNAVGHLDPTYDNIIGPTNPRLFGLWAYCYDTLAPVSSFEWRDVVSLDLIGLGYADPGDRIRLRWVFASDQLASGQGYFMDDLHVSGVLSKNIPVITTKPDTIAIQGVEYMYDVDAFDFDGDSLAYSLPVRPSWLSIDPVTGVINGVPPMNTSGDTRVSVVVRDTNEGWDLQTYFLHVFPQIDLALSPIGPVIIPRGDVLEFSTTIQNNRENIIGGDYWLSVLMPDSSEIVIPEILLNYANPLSGQILPSDTVELSNWLLIPTQAEPGSYRLIGRVGQFPNTIIDEESFGFQVVE